MLLTYLKLCSLNGVSLNDPHPLIGTVYEWVDPQDTVSGGSGCCYCRLRVLLGIGLEYCLVEAQIAAEWRIKLVLCGILSLTLYNN